MAGSIPCKSSGNLCTSFNETHSASKSSVGSGRKRCSPHKSLSARVTHSKSSPILSTSTSSTIITATATTTSSSLLQQSQVRRGSVEMSNNFASPTLSSLSKIKPIAVIKAYDDLTGSKELLEKSRVLVKMKASVSKSPSIERARVELEEVITQKSMTIIQNDLINVKKACISWLNELSARAGDANYRHEIASELIHDDTKIQLKAVETFISASGERTQLMNDCCKKFNSWRQVINNCREVQSNLSIQVVNEICEEVNKSDEILTTNLESAFIWLNKIAFANTKTMCYYLHLLDLNSISNVCSFNRQLISLANNHSMIHFIDEINEIQILAQIKGKIATNQIKYVLCLNCNNKVNNKYNNQEEDDDVEERVTFEEEEDESEQIKRHEEEENDEEVETQDDDDDDDEQVSTSSPQSLRQIDASSDQVEQSPIQSLSEETFTLFLEKLIATNERILLKLIYSKDFDTTVGMKCNRVNTRSTGRKNTRSTWKTLCHNRSTDENIYLFTYYEHIYWNIFWFTIKVSLESTATATGVRDSMNLSTSTSTTTTSSSVNLDSLNYLREVSTDEIFASSVANEYVQSIYKHLHGLFTSELWSCSHRQMIQEMSKFDGSNVEQTIDSSKQMTRIGCLCYSSLHQLKLHLINCETNKTASISRQVQHLPEEIKLLMTISINSYLNWLQCEDILKVWNIKCALILTLGDLIKLIDLLKQIDYICEVNQFISDITSVQHRTWNLIVNSMLESIFTCILIDTLSTQEYKCKSSKVRVNEHCTLNILHKIQVILSLVHQLTCNVNIKQNIIDILSKSILIAIKQIDTSKKLSIKFSKNGNKLLHQGIIINILSEACRMIQVTIVLSDRQSVQLNLPNLYNLLTLTGQPVPGKQLSLGWQKDDKKQQQQEEEEEEEKEKISVQSKVKEKDEGNKSSNYCKNKVAPIQVSTNISVPGTTLTSLTSTFTDHKEKSTSGEVEKTGEMSASAGVSASVTSNQQAGGTGGGGGGRGSGRWFLCM